MRGLILEEQAGNGMSVVVFIDRRAESEATPVSWHVGRPWLEQAGSSHPTSRLLRVHQHSNSYSSESCSSEASTQQFEGPNHRGSPSRWRNEGGSPQGLAQRLPLAHSTGSIDQIVASPARWTPRSRTDSAYSSLSTPQPGADAGADAPPAASRVCRGCAGGLRPVAGCRHFSSAENLLGSSQPSPAWEDGTRQPEGPPTGELAARERTLRRVSATSDLASHSAANRWQKAAASSPPVPPARRDSLRLKRHLDRGSPLCGTAQPATLAVWSHQIHRVVSGPVQPNRPLFADVDVSPVGTHGGEPDTESRYVQRTDSKAAHAQQKVMAHAADHRQGSGKPKPAVPARPSRKTFHTPRADMCAPEDNAIQVSQNGVYKENRQQAGHGGTCVGNEGIVSGGVSTAFLHQEDHNGNYKSSHSNNAAPLPADSLLGSGDVAGTLGLTANVYNIVRVHSPNDMSRIGPNDFAQLRRAENWGPDSPFHHENSMHTREASETSVNDVNYRSDCAESAFGSAHSERFFCMTAQQVPEPGKPAGRARTDPAGDAWPCATPAEQQFRAYRLRGQEDGSYCRRSVEPSTPHSAAAPHPRHKTVDRTRSKSSSELNSSVSSRDLETGHRQAHASWKEHDDSFSGSSGSFNQRSFSSEDVISAEKTPMLHLLSKGYSNASVSDAVIYNLASPIKYPSPLHMHSRNSHGAVAGGAAMEMAQKANLSGVRSRSVELIDKEGNREDNNIPSASDEAFTTSYSQSIKAAQSKVLSATSFSRKDLNFKPVQAPLLSNFSGCNKTTRWNHVPSSGQTPHPKPKKMEHPVQQMSLEKPAPPQTLDMETIARAFHPYAQKQLSAEMKKRSYSEPEKLHEIARLALAPVRRIDAPCTDPDNEWSSCVDHRKRPEHEHGGGSSALQHRPALSRPPLREQQHNALAAFMERKTGRKPTTKEAHPLSAPPCETTRRFLTHQPNSYEYRNSSNNLESGSHSGSDSTPSPLYRPTAQQMSMSEINLNHSALRELNSREDGVQNLSSKPSRFSDSLYLYQHKAHHPRPRGELMTTSNSNRKADKFPSAEDLLERPSHPVHVRSRSSPSDRIMHLEPTDGELGVAKFSCMLVPASRGHETQHGPIPAREKEFGVYPVPSGTRQSGTSSSTEKGEWSSQPRGVGDHARSFGVHNPRWSKQLPEHHGDERTFPDMTSIGSESCNSLWNDGGNSVASQVLSRVKERSRIKTQQDHLPTAVGEAAPLGQKSPARSLSAFEDETSRGDFENEAKVLLVEHEGHKSHARSEGHIARPDAKDLEPTESAVAAGPMDSLMEEAELMNPSPPPRPPLPHPESLGWRPAVKHGQVQSEILKSQNTSASSSSGGSSQTRILLSQNPDSPFTPSSQNEDGDDDVFMDVGRAFPPPVPQLPGSLHISLENASSFGEQTGRSQTGVCSPAPSHPASSVPPSEGAVEVGVGDSALRTRTPKKEPQGAAKQGEPAVPEATHDTVPGERGQPALLTPIAGHPQQRPRKRRPRPVPDVDERHARELLVAVMKAMAEVEPGVGFPDLLLPENQAHAAAHMMEEFFPEMEEALEEEEWEEEDNDRPPPQTLVYDRASPSRASSASPQPCDTSTPKAAPAEHTCCKEGPQNSAGDNDNPPLSQAADVDITNMKEELLRCVERQLERLKIERAQLAERVGSARSLARAVEAAVQQRCRPSEVDKFSQLMSDMDTLVSLLLSICGRLARTQSALEELGSDGNPECRRSLEIKAQDLRVKREDARDLQQALKRRECSMAAVLASRLDDREMSDYYYLTRLKPALLIAHKRLEESVRLREQQARAVRESLPWQVARVGGMEVSDGELGAAPYVPALQTSQALPLSDSFAPAASATPTAL
ncbi:protein Shroom3-like [Lethenteron reissneri]|uniref:protein Shroom3-like n=1 Tax=Lethenteron reissneri TaxID=7753 RepID=UPI002AB77080|nr:protein Shroom3-like [Lethenteron reissneri]